MYDHRSFLIPTLFPWTPVVCDTPANNKMCAWKHKQNCLHLFPNSAKTERKQSLLWRPVLPADRTKAVRCRTGASARSKPVLIQSNGQRGVPIQTASPQIIELSDKLFLFVFLSLSISHCHPPFLPYSPLGTLPESGESLAWAGVKTKRVGGSLSHLFYPSLLYPQPRWQFVSWTCMLCLSSHISVIIIIHRKRQIQKLKCNMLGQYSIHRL